MNLMGVWMLIIFLVLSVLVALKKVFIAEKVECRIAYFIYVLINTYTIYCLCHLMRLI